MNWLSNLFSGGGLPLIIAIITPIILIVMKKIPNEKIKAKVGAIGYGIGITCTIGLAKWKWSAGLWNKIIEAYFIDLIDNTIVCFVENFIKGLRSD